MIEENKTEYVNNNKQKGNKNKTIILVLIIIILILVAIIIGFTIKSNRIYDDNNEEVYKDENDENIIISDNEENNDDENLMERADSWYEDPDNGASTIMPDLVGMYVEDAKDVFSGNIKVKYTRGSNADYKYATKIVQTIPAAGETLEYDEDVTVLAEYVYILKRLYFITNSKAKEIETKYFGEKIKIQFSDDESRFVEGIIGVDFVASTSLGDDYTCKYNIAGQGSELTTLERIRNNKVLYMTEDEAKEGLNIKVWIGENLVLNSKKPGPIGIGSDMNISINL